MEATLNARLDEIKRCVEEMGDSVGIRVSLSTRDFVVV